MRMRLLLALLATAFGATAGTAGEPDFTTPRAGLHTGGQPDADDLRAFAADGVSVVIDLRGRDEPRGYDEPALARSLGVRYVSLPITGAEDLTPANAAALEEALDSAEGPVLLHCASGNRVGALLAMAAAQEEGATPDAAFALGRAAGLGSLAPVVRERLGLPNP
jgi:uncharacterized protein (TIGR01244 family)